MSEDIDELRRYLTAEVGNGAQGPQGPAGAKGDTGVSTYLNGIVLSTGVSSEIGNGNSGAVINLKTAYNSAETNYVAIKVMTTSTGQVIYGAVIIIADI